MFEIATGLHPLFAPAQPGDLRYKHPDWLWRYPTWEMARLAYVGGREFLEPRNITYPYIAYSKQQTTGADNLTTTKWVEQRLQIPSMLVRHARESSSEFAARSARATYYNMVRPIINELCATALREEPTREGDAQLTEFWGAADETRTQSLSAMLRAASPWAETLGIMHACVDVKTAADGGDGKPYLYWVAPIDILDWQVDDDGNYEWLKQFTRVERRRTFRGQVELVYRYRIWTKTDLTVIETDDKGSDERIIGTRPHAFGAVPFIPLYSQKDPDANCPHGIPRTGDMVRAAIRVFNLVSLLDEILAKQTFSQLCLPDPNVDEVEIGMSSAITYDGARGGEVKYISPDPEQARVLLEAIGSALEHIRSVVGVGRGRSESSKDQASGAALELEGEAKKTIVADVAASAEDFERRLAAFLTRIRTGTPGEVFVQYPREFDLRSFAATVADATSFTKLDVGPMAKRLELQNVVRKRFRNLPPDELDALIEGVPEQQAQAEPEDNEEPEK